MNTTVQTAAKSGISFRSIAGRIQQHLLPVAVLAAIVCIFAGVGYAVNPNTSDMWTMYVSGAVTLAAVLISDRKGGTR